MEVSCSFNVTLECDRLEKTCWSASHASRDVLVDAMTALASTSHDSRIAM